MKINKMINKEKCLAPLSNLSQLILKGIMYGDEFGKFVCVWGLKG